MVGRVSRTMEEQVLAANGQQAAVGLVHAAEDLDQRRLAGTVLADERVHLAGVQLQRDVVESADAGEGLARPQKGQ